MLSAAAAAAYDSNCFHFNLIIADDNIPQLDHYRADMR